MKLLLNRMDHYSRFGKRVRSSTTDIKKGDVREKERVGAAGGGRGRGRGRASRGRAATSISPPRSLGPSHTRTSEVVPPSLPM